MVYPQGFEPDMLLQSYRARYHGAPLGSKKINHLHKNCAHREVSQYPHIPHISKDYVELLPQNCHIESGSESALSSRRDSALWAGLVYRPHYQGSWRAIILYPRAIMHTHASLKAPLETTWSRPEMSKSSGSLLCSNVKAAGSSRTFVMFGV